MNAFILDGQINSRSDLGLRITQPPQIPPSRRIVNTIEVDGREGSLTILRGWRDMTFTLRAAIIGTDSHRRFREVLPVITAAKTIHFSNDTAVFYKIKHVQAGALERRLSNLHDFPLTFTCAPFRYMRGVANIVRTASGTITNPGTVFSLPRIAVFGSGNRTLTINGRPIILNILQGSLILDSELKICHFGNVAQNNRMVGDFPVFNIGNNTITLGTGITRVEIEGRWRHL
jgi:phage-related protein